MVWGLPLAETARPETPVVFPLCGGTLRNAPKEHTQIGTKAARKNPEPLSRSEPARERPPALCAIANASTSSTQPLQFRLPLSLPLSLSLSLRLPPHGQVLSDTARPLDGSPGKPTDGKPEPPAWP